jgi:hypothetical protein
MVPWFDHNLTIIIADPKGKQLFKKIYKGTVADAYQPQMYSDGHSAGVIAKPINCDLVIQDIVTKLESDPLP